jgi:signal transduction histidine kinase
VSLRSQRALSEQGAAALTTARHRAKGEATSDFQESLPLSFPRGADRTEQDRLQRAAIVGQLVGGIVHDFNNVLTVITGMIDILAEAVADKPQLAGAARLIDQAAARGALLTSRLLAFARSGPAAPREIDVAALLDEASRLLRPTLRGVEVAMTMPVDAPPALADTGGVMAAILSLAVLARDAMPEGGKLVFGVGACASDRRAHARARQAGENVVITVDAHGYGEVAQHAERILTDVGMARDFVTRAGGRLDVCASTGGFARVEIALPALRKGRDG